MYKRYTAVFVTVSLMFSATPSLGGETGLVIPKDLNEIAEARGCTQVADFFARLPRVLSPPYVYGLTGAVGDWSAAFWCVRRAGEDRELVLMLHVPDGGSVAGDCPSEIVGLPRMGGLSVIASRGETLERFWTVSKPRRRGAAGVLLSRPLLMSSYDGVGSDFYCHDGEWYFRPFH